MKELHDQRQSLLNKIESSKSKDTTNLEELQDKYEHKMRDLNSEISSMKQMAKEE